MQKLLGFVGASVIGSVAWWADMLGFEPSYVMKEYGWCELHTSIDGVGLGLGQVEEVKIGGTTPTFGVSDIDFPDVHGAAPSLEEYFDQHPDLEDYYDAALGRVVTPETYGGDPENDWPPGNHYLEGR